MYEIIKPAKFTIYTTTKSNKMIASQVRAKTGADIVINGTLYNVNTWVPVCDVKQNGKVLSNDKYIYWGYGWDPLDKRMVMCNNISRYENYITAAALIKDGKDLLITANPDVARKSGRTAIGFREDGKMVVWCTGEGIENMTLETLREKMRTLGCVDALALDGGGSSQLSKAGIPYVYSSRKVQNYICIWIEKENETPTAPVTSNYKYKKPSSTLRQGSTGDGVKWIQHRLNEKLKFDENGNFNSILKSGVELFQKMNGLVSDGIVGPQTISALS